jgi:hypothetical protein
MTFATCAAWCATRTVDGMNTLIMVLRGLHIGFGGLSLLSFWIPWAVRKGGLAHRRAGWVYTLSMGVVATSSVTLAVLRLTDSNPDNDPAAIFLGSLGVLAIATALHGLGTLRRGGGWRVASLSSCVALVLSGSGLVLTGVRLERPLFLIFGALSVVTAARQLRFTLRPPASRLAFVLEHLRAMGATCIATVTAFVVVNAQTLGVAQYQLVVWLTPGVVGGVAIAWWRRRLGSRADRASVAQADSTMKV